MADDLTQVTIYTDGACTGNPGPGGYGVVLLHGSHRRELSGGFRKTTNNRMELMAAIAGLGALKRRCRVTLYTDSRYVAAPMIDGRARVWRDNGWRLNRREKAKNRDLWARLIDACDPHEVHFEWVRGHAGNVENERCDALSVAAAGAGGLPIDEGFENPEPDEPLFGG